MSTGQLHRIWGSRPFGLNGSDEVAGQLAERLDWGEVIALQAPMGTGKTTLLKLIMRELEADAGSITVPPRWRIGVTRQEAPEGDGSLVDAVLAADTELQALNAEAETATDPDRIARIHERLAEKDAHSARSRAARSRSANTRSHTASDFKKSSEQWHRSV